MFSQRLHPCKFPAPVHRVLSSMAWPALSSGSQRQFLLSDVYILGVHICLKGVQLTGEWDSGGRPSPGVWCFLPQAWL